MRKVILQLFLRKSQVVREISIMQDKPRKEWNEEELDAKHREWDNCEKMIALFFEAVGM